MKIIRDRAIVDDDYVHVADGAELPADGARPIVTLVRYLADREALLARYSTLGALGVKVPPGTPPGGIPDLERLALVAIEIPSYTEGRGYSVARVLRDRHAFRGELRAVGWVTRDDLFYLERCGFNAFEMRAGKPLESALEAFGEFTVTYQAAADDPRPLYRRR